MMAAVTREVIGFNSKEPLRRRRSEKALRQGRSLFPTKYAGDLARKPAAVKVSGVGLPKERPKVLTRMKGDSGEMVLSPA